MTRKYKWRVPIEALRSLSKEPELVARNNGWFTSAEISERAESLCRWDVAPRAVTNAMKLHSKHNRVEGRRVKQQSFSQANVEVWTWKLMED